MLTGLRCGGRWLGLREGLVDLLLPLVCVVCGDLLGGGSASLACARCWARARALPEPRCERCGHPFPGLELAELALDADPGAALPRCGWCELLPPYVRAARSVCWATWGTGGELVHALKYGGWTRLAGELAQRMARASWPPDVAEERAALVPVPLSSAKERERGFNQSELLASHLGALLGLEVWSGVLCRARATRTQTRLTPEERAANVSGAFVISPGAESRVRGTHLILVDDVVTTCATLNECATALFTAGARLSSYLTFARARAASDK
ncbi:ComF family protein [soil metagenome]